MTLLTKAETHELLVAYADGDLSPEDAARVKHALEHYPECRNALEEYQASLGIIEQSFPPMPPARVPQSAAVTRIAKTRVRRRRLSNSLAVVVTCLAAVIVVKTGLQHPTDTVEGPLEVVTQSTDLGTLNERIQTLRQRIDRSGQDYRRMARQMSALGSPPVETSREEIAAILVTAARNLKEEYGNTEDALQRYQYVLSNYADTRAAESGRAQLRTLSGSTI